MFSLQRTFGLKKYAKFAGNEILLFLIFKYVYEWWDKDYFQDTDMKSQIVF